MNDLENMRKKIAELSPRVYSISVDKGYLADKLPRMIDKSKAVIEATIEHIESGDLEDQATNTIVWHDLNAGLHYVNLLLDSVSNSKDRDMLNGYHEIMITLKDMRPPKE